MAPSHCSYKCTSDATSCRWICKVIEWLPNLTFRARPLKTIYQCLKYATLTSNVPINHSIKGWGVRHAHARNRNGTQHLRHRNENDENGNQQNWQNSWHGAKCFLNHPLYMHNGMNGGDGVYEWKMLIIYGTILTSSTRTCRNHGSYLGVLC